MHLHAPLRLSTLAIAIVIILLIVLARLSSAQQAASTPSQAAPAKAAPPAAAPPPRNKAAAPAPSAPASTPSAMLPAPAPLSDVERIHLRTAQVRSLRSQSLRVCTTIAELAQSPEWQEAQQADAAFRAAIDAIYTARHVDPADAVLCDGPGQGTAANPACAGLAKDVLEIRAVTRPAAAK